MTRKTLLSGFVLLFFSFIIFIKTSDAQLPSNVLVGYHENWRSLRLTQAHNNYNVICLAFAVPSTPMGSTMTYDLPLGYSTIAQMRNDIDVLHSQGKVVLLSVGGAFDPFRLNTVTDRINFENSITAIFTAYGNKIDGLDLDLETSSMSFGPWTMSSPAAGQIHMINGVKNIMATYLATNSKKMILTAAPEAVYLMGGLSEWQVDNVHGGAFLPILDGLKNELDLLHMQLYNAGGASGGVRAWDGNLYYDNGTIDFALAMNESIIKGFTLVYGMGTFTGIPASKVAFGFPASTAPTAAGTGYVLPAHICDGVRYFRGQISKPATATYTMSASYPSMKGVMTWSVDEDNVNPAGQWNFATGVSCALTLPVQFASFSAKQQNQQVKLTWQTVMEENADYFSIQKSSDGIYFEEIGRVNASGNSNILLTYDYTDNSPSAGTVYYRIKETDLDGAVTYSDIRTIQNQLFGIQVSPNPSGGTFTLHASQNIQAILQTLTGNTIEVITADSDSHTFGENLAPGVYILSVQAGEQTEYLRLIKE